MNMLKNKDTQKVAGAIVIVLLLGFVGWYIARDFSPLGSQKGVESTIAEEGIENLVENGGVEIQKIEVPNEPLSDTRPQIDRVVIIPERFSGEAEAILRGNIATLTTQLKSNPNLFASWSDLAIQYKIIDDFDGAIEIWMFLNEATENNTISRINLGNLYHFQLKEFEKSETLFKEALDIDVETSDAYRGLHELYRYSYKTDTTLAIDILKEGIAAVPSNTDIRMLLASYYTELGMNDKAIEVYEGVLVIANDTGDINLTTITEAAIESIK